MSAFFSWCSLVVFVQISAHHSAIASQVNVVVYILDSKAQTLLVSKSDVEAIDPATGISHVTRVYDAEGHLFFASARQFVVRHRSLRP